MRDTRQPENPIGAFFGKYFDDLNRTAAPSEPEPQPAPPQDADSLDAIQLRHKAAIQMVSDLCARKHEAGHRDWVMSIPAQPDYDPDLVIASALNDIPKLRAQVAKLTEERDKLEKGMQLTVRAFIDSETNRHAAEQRNRELVRALTNTQTLLSNDFISPRDIKEALEILKAALDPTSSRS